MPTTTKKVYVSVAATLSRLHDVTSNGMSRPDQKHLAHVIIDRITNDLAAEFAEDNPAFNHETFFKAAQKGVR